MSRGGHLVRTGFPRDMALKIAAGMSDPDPERAQFYAKAWAKWWEEALSKVRQFNDREFLQGMLDTGYPVPAEIARQLLDLKGPRHRPSATRLTPEEVVFFVRAAISEGHKFPASDGANEGHSAFDVVAERIGCDVNAVRTQYKNCPREVRDEIKQRREEFDRHWEDIDQATTDEEAKKIEEALKTLKDAGWFSED